MTLDNPKERNIYLYDDVDQYSILKIVEKIIEIENNDKKLTIQYESENLTYKPLPIKLYIDIYGGTIYACYGLLSVIEKCSTPQFLPQLFLIRINFFFIFIPSSKYACPPTSLPEAVIILLIGKNIS